jgi:hypothetical protein
MARECRIGILCIVTYPNPLAIGVSFGGQFLDVVVPRPKLRVGLPHEFSLLSQRPDTRTASTATTIPEFVGASVASGGHH